MHITLPAGSVILPFEGNTLPLEGIIPLFEGIIPLSEGIMPPSKYKMPSFQGIKPSFRKETCHPPSCYLQPSEDLYKHLTLPSITPPRPAMGSFFFIRIILIFSWSESDQILIQRLFRKLVGINSRLRDCEIAAGEFLKKTIKILVIYSYNIDMDIDIIDMDRH